MEREKIKLLEEKIELLKEMNKILNDLLHEKDEIIIKLKEEINIKKTIDKLNKL